MKQAHPGNGNEFKTLIYIEQKGGVDGAGDAVDEAFKKDREALTGRPFDTDAMKAAVPLMILTESFISFLGLGVQEPLTSLGRLISAGAQDMEPAPWTLIGPAVTMMVTLFCLNFIGDGLRDAIDPKDR